MNENNSNPSEPRKLNDSELNEVAGGKGKWDAAKEADIQFKYQRAIKSGEKGGFDSWYRSTYGMGSGNLRIALDDLEARKLWLAKGSPEDETIYYG